MKLLLTLVLGFLLGASGFYFVMLHPLLNQEGIDSLPQPADVSASKVDLESTNNDSEALVLELRRKLSEKDAEIEYLNQLLLERQTDTSDRVNGAIPDEHYLDAKARFDNEITDYDWAYEIETRYSNFINELAYADRLTSEIICRKSMCQLTMDKPDIELWNEVLVSLDRQTWWNWKYMYFAHEGDREDPDSQTLILEIQL